MTQEEYKNRFLNHLHNLHVEEEIAKSEYDAFIESNPNVWELDCADPENDADECTYYWD
jgi:hypothetical protein